MLDRVYRRDKDGKFASTGGVRESLAAANTTQEIGAAASAEAKRITGRDIPFDMSGSDLHVAREYSEGILRGVERFPGARLNAVSTGDLGGRGMAQTRRSGDGYEVVFDRDVQGAGQRHGVELFREDLHMSQAGHQTVYGDPTGVALHEYGHVVVNSQGSVPAMYERAHATANARNVDIDDMVYSNISEYATTNPREMAAEAFADVMLHGSAASSLSSELFSVIEGG